MKFPPLATSFEAAPPTIEKNTVPAIPGASALRTPSAAPAASDSVTTNAAPGAFPGIEPPPPSRASNSDMDQNAATSRQTTENPAT